LKLTALFSGGKDSIYAIYYALSQGWDVSHLITTIPIRKYESLMWHYPAINWTELQAKVMGIRQLKIEASSLNELEELKNVLRELRDQENVDGVLSGVMASDYQKNRLDFICEDLNLKLIAPLWQKDPIKILKEIINSGFKVIIVSVSAYGFTKDWLGREINEETINDLKRLYDKFKINPCGEGGEFETFVYDCPIFKERIEILDYEVKWYRYSGVFIIKKARAIPKLLK